MRTIQNVKSRAVTFDASPGSSSSLASNGVSPHHGDTADETSVADLDRLVAEVPGSRSGLIRVVALVEGSPLHAFGFEILVNSMSEDVVVVGMTTNLGDVVHQVESNRPDIVLMDVRLADSDNLEVARRIRDGFPLTKVVMLVDHVQRRGIQEAIELGISGFFTSHMNAEKLLDALRLIRAGEAVIDPSALATLFKEPEPGAASLTTWDLAVLKLVAEGLENEEVAKKLAISKSTLKRNLQSILVKMNVTNRVHAAVCAAREGLI